MGHILPIIERNFALNHVNRDVCKVAPFDWTNPTSCPTSQAQVILAADCVYSLQLAKLFTRALFAAMTPAITAAFVCSKIRSTSLIRELECEFDSAGLQWAIVDGGGDADAFIIHRVTKSA
jgi:hypothetical protein